jgi:hypothetical protein
MALCDHEGARVADNEPWVEIRTAAEQELRKIGTVTDFEAGN